MTKFTAYMFTFYGDHPRLNPDGTPIETQAEGEVWYEIYDGERYHHLIQTFRRGSLIRQPDDIYNIWSWDGNRENPTIRPSFRVPDYNFHCFVTNGKIDVLPDSAVENVAVRKTWDEFHKVEK